MRPSLDLLPDGTAGWAPVTAGESGAAVLRDHSGQRASTCYSIL